ncbi:alpha/beta hydrolase [Croceicoccus naphthovorans]|uniref:Uncharacterized protein n=1 Tax=Croceicoccus naphthovorans TaxID=1348774 RepID=A0A0G3XK40_9SPHN|nr:alpha/beta hydrolase [Croceicoccus naphthovorans]AKM11547.1 hypothetical protein AB433_05015 [Croceicoccus naphthovorans]MBB3991503.1 acetyl esterase [Croceicoccus naphthovorans]
MSELHTGDVQDDVDPKIREFVNGINAGYDALLPETPLSMPERRAIAERVREPWRSGGPRMAETQDYDVVGVRLRVHRPTDAASLPAMLYIHGGGWALFSIDTHDRLMREYASRAGIVVVGIDYSLSPEAKFPAALNEAVSAIGWMRENADDLGIDPARIAVGGDSAGGNLAVSTCLKLRELGLPQLQGMVLNYGAFAPDHTPSYARYDGPNYCLTVDEMDAFWDDYLADPSQKSDPLAVPTLGDLHDLPPAFMAIAKLDILRDCNHTLAEKLADVGVAVEAVEYETATHSFLEAMSIAPLASRALDDQAKWLRSALGVV